jgi:arylsulfatase A
MTRFKQTLCFGLIVCSAIFLNAAETRHPNIVLLFADDMGYGEVQGLNPERGKIPTPHLDQLIKEGMHFTDAHTASSVCTPSRYALLTGRYCWRTTRQSGVTTGGGDPLIADDRLTVAELLQEQGYATAIAGKWHLNFHYEGERATVGTRIPDGPITRGFETWLGFHHARNMKELIKDDTIIEIIDPIDMLPRTTDFAVAYINQRAANAKTGKPFFLYVPFGSPHTPIVPTKAWEGKSGLSLYADFVMMTDGMAGRIIDAIDANGLKENTLVIFSCDNGTSARPSNAKQLEQNGHFSSADLRGYKADLWDGGHRVPFIVRWPGGGVEAGSRSDQLIGLSDVTATFAEITRYALPDNAAEDSISFLPALTGKDIPQEREAIVHHSISGHFSIRKGKWKLLLASGSGGWTAPKKTQNGPVIQLYDMSKDLGETTNLQDKHPEQVAELTKLLKSYVAQGRSTPGPTMKNDTDDIQLHKDGQKKKTR